MTNRRKLRLRKRAIKARQLLLLAKAYEVVTCPEGHPQFLTLNIIRPDDIVWLTSLLPLANQDLDLQGYNPKYYTWGACTVCKNYVFPSADKLYIKGQLRGHGGRYVKLNEELKHG